MSATFGLIFILLFSTPTFAGQGDFGVYLGLGSMLFIQSVGILLLVKSQNKILSHAGHSPTLRTVSSNSDKKIKYVGVPRFKELFDLDFSRASKLFFSLLEENEKLAIFLISQLPLSVLIEMHKKIERDNSWDFPKLFKEANALIDEGQNKKLDDDLLKFLSEKIFLDPISERKKYTIVRAERWAALIKKDVDLGRYLFTFSDLEFVSKVFSFLDKSEISLVMDQVFKSEESIEPVRQKVESFLEEQQGKINTNQELQRMLRFLGDIDGEHFGLGVEKLSIYLKNEAKIFKVLVQNMTPSLFLLVPNEIFSRIYELIPEEALFEYFKSLPQSKRGSLFDCFLSPHQDRVDSYKRYLAKNSKTSSEVTRSSKSFKKMLGDLILSNSDVSNELYASWRLPIKRLAEGMSFEKAFKTSVNLKKTA